MATSEKPAKKSGDRHHDRRSQLPLQPNILRRAHDALHGFGEWFEDETSRALGAARSRQLAPLRHIEQICRFLLRRYVGGDHGPSTSPKVPKPAGFSVKPDLAAGLTFVDGDAFARHIDGLSAAIAALSSFEGVPFRRPPLLLGTLAERAQKRTRLRDEAAKSSETQAENAGLDTVERELTNLMDLFQDAASQLKSRLLSASKKRRAGAAKPSSVMTPPQVAKRLRVTADKVRHWITSGELKAFNAATGAGGRARWKISEENLAEFQHTRQSQKPIPPSRRPRKKSSDVIDFFPES